MGRLLRQSVALTGIAVTSTALGLVVPSVGLASTGSSSAPSVKAERVCSEAKPGFRACFAERVVSSGGHVVPNVPSGYGPSDLASAYNLPASGGEGITVAIVDAYNDPSAESDLGTYRSTYGLPACTTANGCFKKVNQNGASSPLPPSDTGWAAEIALDIDMVSAGCPSCRILLVEANSASNADLDAAVNYAATHAQIVSNSYGGGESSGETSDSSYNHPGTLILASSGDEGFEVEFPAASPTVLAVGGTRLVRDGSSRGWTETVWNTSNSEGTGSGCSRYETKPSWQTDTGCTKRTVADVSAVADPATGVAVYDSFGSGGWAVYGGTSVSSPLVGAIFALTGHATATPQYPYANPTNFYDVTSGQTSTSCSSYLCRAQVGYDGPTGMGTPNGNAMAGSGPPPNDFSITLNPSSGSLPAGSKGTAKASVITTTTAGSAQTVNLSATGIPPAATVTFKPASLTSGQKGKLIIKTKPATPAGVYTITVTGTAASGPHSATYMLTISP